MKRYLLSPLGSLALAMAFYAAVWTVLCEHTGMASWIGFAGCTTYFASGKKSFQGIGTAFAVNIAGTGWALLSITAGRLWDWEYGTAVLCAVISYLIIIQANIKALSFIPGAYIGCFTTFAAGGDWKQLIPALTLGILLGWATDVTGTWLHQRVIKTYVEEGNIIDSSKS